ncbi:hypothetical protein E5206_08530 [Arthrobacter sp. PAMC25564]|uniref:hypothetical protein n=1 Tax=Arthrobacter sp. PAMC25564 TaxID=2565366 RepID=UPI0010A24D7F|nr:hypothetical protein [Arthrobacter sp. PAMC25564]QCB96968.1 hypothetical protein E5206_08530 [Arthrobacter sp. PAMC25564]
MKNIGIRFALLISTYSLLLRRHSAPGPGAGQSPARRNDDHERGDVPGWVMITLMSAVLVAALLALAGPALEALFNQAMDKVRG